MKKVIMLGCIAVMCVLSKLKAMESSSFREALDKTRAHLLLESKCFSWKNYFFTGDEIDPNKLRDKAGNTLLHWRIVAYCKSYEWDHYQAIVQLLYDSRTRHDIENYDGVTAFDLADAAKEEKIIEMMLGKDYKDNKKVSSCEMNHHIIATHTDLYKKTEWQKWLNYDCYGNTYLHWLVACRAHKTGPDHLKLISDLFYGTHKPLFDKENKKGVTAFDLAQDAGDCQVIALMLDRDFDISSDFFVTQVGLGNIFVVSKLLENRYLDINVRSFDRTALEYAVLNVDYEMVKLLLTHSELDPNIQNIEGNTVLHWLVLWENAAPQDRYLDLIDLLLNDPRTRCDVPNYGVILSDDEVTIKFSQCAKKGKTVYKLAIMGLLMSQAAKRLIIQAIVQSPDLVL